MGEMLTTSAICFAMTLIGLSLGFVLLKVTQGEGEYILPSDPYEENY